MVFAVLALVCGYLIVPLFSHLTFFTMLYGWFKYFRRKVKVSVINAVAVYNFVFFYNFFFFFFFFLQVFYHVVWLV